MRYALIALFSAPIVAGACTGEPRGDFDPPLAAKPIDESPPPVPSASCGDASSDGSLPPGATRDDAAHEVTLACAGTSAALTVLDDGIVRVRYGDAVKAPTGSLVPIERPASKSPLVVGRRQSAVVVCTKELEVTVDLTRPGCAITAKDLATGAVVLDDGAGGGFFHEQTTDQNVLGVTRRSPSGERIYGLGLHTASRDGKRLDLRGSVVELYNTDAFDAAAGGFRPDAPSLYESIPFYIGLRGKTAYGVFTDNTHRLRFDVAKSDPEKLTLRANGGAIDQYLVAGPSMKDVIRRYTSLTGRTPMPPPWALGFHQSRWEGPCEATPVERPFCSAPQIAALAQSFRDRGIPADGLFLDIQHMNGFRSFTFDGARFADPDGLFADLASRGFHATPIVDPGIKVDASWSVYQAGLAGGFFLRAPGDASKAFEGEVWPGAAVFPDFANGKTRTWWSDLVRGLAARGAAGMWIDMNEPASFTTGTVPDAVPVSADGRATTMAEAHNAYGFFEAKATYEGLLAARPNERPFVISRAAFAGQQKWSGVWTGDAPSTWTTLGMTLPQLLHLGLSGIPFAGSDVGGYSGREESTSDLFTRWMAVGAISPFFRAHAEKDARRQEPWAFGGDVEDATRALVSFRYELLPYLYSLFDESTRTGVPVLRPLVLEHQDDEAVLDVADEAMLGPALLVAPIVDRGPATSRAVKLPKGRWFDFRSGAFFEGGRTVTITSTTDPLPRDALPVFAREGAIVPRADVAANVERARGGGLYLDAFPGPTKTSFTLREDDGTKNGTPSRITFATERKDGAVRFEASAREGSFVQTHSKLVVRLRRVDHEPSSLRVDGGSFARAASALDVPTGSWAWDTNDRAIVVALPDRFPFAIDATFDTKLEPDGDVEVPIRVAVPAGTPESTAIHVASSHDAWTHRPLVRSGDIATGTVKAPRGGYASFKITRGGWPTVEKGDACAEIDNRRAFGAGARPIAVRVVAFADRCP